MKTVKRGAAVITLPTQDDVTRAGVKASLRMKLDDSVVNRELNEFRRVSGVKVIPSALLSEIRTLINAVKKQFLEEMGIAVMESVRSGGFLTSVEVIGNGRVETVDSMELAGNRPFNVRSGQLSNSIRYSVSSSGLLTVVWGPADSRDPPELVYPEPTQPSIPRDRNTLKGYARSGQPTPSISKVAAIEAGDPAFQRMGVGGYGFGIFEGAVDASDHVIEKAFVSFVKSVLYDKRLYSNNGNKLTLPEYLQSITYDKMKKAVAGDLDSNMKSKANPSSLRSSYTGNQRLSKIANVFKELAPKGDRSYEYLDRATLQKLSSKYSLSVDATGVLKGVRLTLDAETRDKIKSEFDKLLGGNI